MTTLSSPPGRGTDRVAGQPIRDDSPSRQGPAPGLTPPNRPPQAAPRAGSRPGGLAVEPERATNWDRFLRAGIGRLSGGISPVGLLQVYLDWLLHLGFSPGKQLELSRKSLRKALKFNLYATR